MRKQEEKKMEYVDMPTNKKGEKEFKKRQEEMKESEYEVFRAFIGQNNQKLYELETQLHKKFDEIVKEWMSIVNQPKSNFWVIGVTSCIYEFLQSWDHHCSTEASKFFLETQGFKVEKVGESEDPFEVRRVLPHF